MYWLEVTPFSGAQWAWLQLGWLRLCALPGLCTHTTAVRVTAHTVDPPAACCGHYDSLSYHCCCNTL
jgi:hypothetical protein